MKNDNMDAMKGIIDGVDYMVRQAVNNAPYDKIYTGVIKAVNGNKYTVTVGGIDYTNIRTAISGLSIGNTVKVVVPQNQMNQMFILTKYDMDISGGGGTAGVTTVNGKSGNVTLTYSDVNALPNTTVIPPEVTEQTVSNWGFTKNTGTYSKPTGGIPKSDLTDTVQTSLNDADTAVQSVKIGSTEYKIGTDVVLPSYPTTLPASDVKEWAKADNKPTYTASEVGALSDTTTHLSGDIPISEKGSANGVATLGSDSKIPSAQLPSYVDDVLEYDTKDDFPTVGESGKIYVDKSTNVTYRWSGTIYVKIGSDLALGETSSTAYAGDKGKANADAITQLQTTVNALPSSYAPTDAQANVIETIKVNNSALTPTNKTVDITIPTQASDIGAMENTVTHLSGDVPITRKINGKDLTTDVTLSASDVGALSDDTNIPTVTDIYSATSSDAMSGKAVASAISGKADTASLPTSYAPVDAEKNVIVGIQKNGTDVTVDSTTRKVNIEVPTVTDVYSSTSTEAMSGKAVASAVNGLQPKLTAGANITIDANNVISATGGGGGGDPMLEYRVAVLESDVGELQEKVDGGLFEERKVEMYRTDSYHVNTYAFESSKITDVVSVEGSTFVIKKEVPRIVFRLTTRNYDTARSSTSEGILYYNDGVVIHNICPDRYVDTEVTNEYVVNNPQIGDTFYTTTPNGNGYPEQALTIGVPTSGLIDRVTVLESNVSELQEDVGTLQDKIDGNSAKETQTETGRTDSYHINVYNFTDASINDIIGNTTPPMFGMYMIKKAVKKITFTLTTRNYDTARSSTSEGILYYNGEVKIHNICSDIYVDTKVTQTFTVENPQIGDVFYTTTPNGNGYPEQTLTIEFNEKGLVDDVSELKEQVSSINTDLTASDGEPFRYAKVDGKRGIWVKEADTDVFIPFKSGGEEPVLLWTNPNPTVAFASGTKVDIDTTPYTELIIEVNGALKESLIPTGKGIVPTGYSGGYGLNIGGHGTEGTASSANCGRAIKLIDATGVTFGGGFNRAGANDNYGVPLNIYGIKGTYTPVPKLDGYPKIIAHLNGVSKLTNLTLDEPLQPNRSYAVIAVAKSYIADLSNWDDIVNLNDKSTAVSFFTYDTIKTMEKIAKYYTSSGAGYTAKVNYVDDNTVSMLLNSTAINGAIIAL